MQRKGVRRRHNAIRIGAAHWERKWIGSRRRLPGIVAVLTSWLSLMSMVSLAGCSLLSVKESSVIRVQTNKNTALAGRLTQSGIRALHKQHIDLAAKHFRDAIQADASYGPAHNNLGLMHYEQGNLYQAVLAFEQARVLLPNDPAVLYNLGLALEAAGRTDEALELYYDANAMDRANPYYLGNLVRLRVRLGEHDEELISQLQDLTMIETRPDWRRWADMQLAIDQNDFLDRGPATPDLDSTINKRTDTRDVDLRSKIIDLTPAVPASLNAPIGSGLRWETLPSETLPSEELPGAQSPAPSPRAAPMDLSPPEPNTSSELKSMLQDGVIEDLTEPGH